MVHSDDLSSALIRTVRRRVKSLRRRYGQVTEVRRQRGHPSFDHLQRATQSGGFAYRGSS